MCNSTKEICEGCGNTISANEMSGVMEMYICNSCEHGTEDNKLNFLTKEIVFKHIEKSSREWQNSHDYWDRVFKPYSNTSIGFDVNVCGNKTIDVEKGTFLATVYKLSLNDETGEYETNYSDVVFRFLIDEDILEYHFDNTYDAETFVESMPTFSSNWDELSKEECAFYLLMDMEKRSIMYDYELFDTDIVEGDIRDLASTLAKLVLNKDVSPGTCLDALVDLIKDELKGTTPSREELHTLITKYCSPCDDMDKVKKFVETKISFSFKVEA